MNLFKSTPEDWEIIDKTILPSAWEQMESSHRLPTEMSGNHNELFNKTVIYVFKNKRNGKLRTERHTS